MTGSRPSRWEKRTTTCLDPGPNDKEASTTQSEGEATAQVRAVGLKTRRLLIGRKRKQLALVKGSPE